MQFAGRPVRPTIISNNLSDKMHVCPLEWTYEDYDITTVKKFRIYFIQKKHIPDGLHDMPHYEVDLRFDSEKPMHYQSRVHDMQENSTYHIELFAINDYGQGDVETFECTTATVDRRQPDDEESEYNAPQAGYLGGEGGNGWVATPSLVALLVSQCVAGLLLRT